MELNLADKVCFDFKIDDGCFMENCPDVKRQNFVDFDDDDDDEGSRDIVDLLPRDPFGMELNIALPSDPFVMGFEISLPKDPFEMDFEIGANLLIGDFSVRDYELDDDQATEDEDKDIDDSKIVAGLNFYWASSLMYEQEDDGDDVGLNTCTEDVWNDNSLGGGGENLTCFGQEKNENYDADGGVGGESLTCFGEEKNENYDADGGEPAADAFLFVLGYLGVKDLLTLEKVCKSLFDAVRDETLVWKNITIDDPLSKKITDDGLLQLTNRAKGTLCSLSLLKCVKITNTGLKEVLERNPRLTKLSVQGCKLSVEGILHDLKAFSSDAMPGIKRLRIGDRSGLTNQHFEDFKFLLGLNDEKSATNYKPRYFRAAEKLSLEDERPIDIETCPRCQQPRQVYDCPCCEEKIHSAKACRGCILCISRCIGCGCCLDNKAYEETFFLDPLCLECYCLHHLLNSSGGHTYFHFFLCG